MKIKNYSGFIKENSSNMKYELLSFFDSNREDIISNGLDFYNLREQFKDILDNLDNQFLEQINSKLSNIELDNKNEFSQNFQKATNLILEELAKKTNESFEWVSNLWNNIKKLASDAIKWISDRIYSISGLLTLGVGALLGIINQWGDGLGIPTEFANVAVNSVIVLGIIIIKYGQANDKYKNYSEE